MNHHTYLIKRFVLAAIVLIFIGSFMGAIPAPIYAQTVRTVHVNQVGYLPNLNKIASAVNTSTTPVQWQLKNSAGAVVASGQTTVFGTDAASGDYVHIADFTGYTTTGTGYTLTVGTAVSDPFDISTTIYNKMKYDALAYFYHNRSGIAISATYAGGSQWARPAGHTGVSPNQGDTNVACLSGSGCSYSLNVSGGWYDAGDHGKYVVNGGISVWTMMNQYERAVYRGTSSAAFGNGKMNIPENTNGVPDILDEARWEMEFLLKMQVPSGQPLAGMVHHKVHDDAWTGLPTRPDQDNQPRHLHAPSTAATLNLAATAAQCARIWKSMDATFSNKCLTAAQTAWTAAQANPAKYAPASDSTGGGAYDDTNVNDDFYWAAAELFITTGSATYLNYMTSSPYYKSIPTNVTSEGNTSMTWGNTQVLGNLSLAIVPNSLNLNDLTTIRNNIAAAANSYLSAINAQGYRVPFSGSSGPKYPWGSNSFVANNGMILAIAYDLTGDASYLNGAAEAMNYILGRNAMDKSYVSGYGENPLQNPHHRFWAFQLNSAYPKPPAGTMSGGPNSGLQDSTASASLSGCAAQKCYMDNTNAYSVNEITINWNAPFAWLTAFLDEKSGAATTSPTATKTNTPASVPTNTPAAATATQTPTKTNTPASVPTNTPAAPTATKTPTKTNTPVAATATKTNTPASVPTNTPAAPTATKTPTKTNTPVTAPTNTSVAATATSGTSTLKLQYKAGDTNATDNQFKPHFNIVNTGTSAVNMTELTIRYYITKGVAGNLVFNCDFATVGCANVKAVFAAYSPVTTTADYYMEVSFVGGTIAAGGSSGEIQTRVNEINFSNFNESNDYSFDPTKLAFADWTKVMLLRNGTVVWGTAP